MSSDTSEAGASPLPTAVRVLVVEDDAVVREILHRQLAQLGHHSVATVSTGREAMEYAHAHLRADDLTLDAILLDARLSDGSGVETAERMSRELGDLAVVLFSGDMLADQPSI